LLSPKDEAIDLTLDELNTVVESSSSLTSLSGPAIRSTKSLYRGRSAPGLLLVYLVKPKSSDKPEHQFDTPFVGIGMSFPSSESGTKVAYIVNAVGRDEYI
jgi:hypothetical protein